MKNKELIKQQLAKRYWGEESKHYDYLRSKDSQRKYILERKTEIMKKFLGKSKGGNILDIACGTGRFFYLYGKRKIYGIDISRDQLKQAKKKDKKAILKICNAEKLCFPPEKFNVVITSQFIEHIPQYAQVLKEMVRVCKKGGTLIIDFPNKYSLTYLPTKIRLFSGKLPYLNLFSKKEIQAIAKKFNLKIIEWDYTVVITPNIFPDFLTPFVKRLNFFLLRIIPQVGYLHYVKFRKK